MTLSGVLIQFVQSTLSGRERATQVTETTPLIEHGLVDSIGLMQIVALVEQETRVRIPDDEISPENFASVEAIVAMVLRLESEKS